MRPALPSTEFADHGLTAEQDLWVAVVAQTVRDLAWWNHGEAEERDLARDAAAWLFNDRHRESFKAVCEFACLDPDYIRKVARRKWEERVHPDWRDVANAIWDLEVTKS